MNKFFAIILTLFSLPALGADYNFSVPVRLEGIPKGIPQVKVLCEVYNASNEQMPIASGYSIRPINSRQGFLFEDVEVKVNLPATQRELQADRYRCHLLLLTPWAKPFWQMPDASSPIEALQPKANSQLITTVTGTIP